MFDFGMFNYFLLSACCIPHTHTHFRPGAGLARGREAGLNCAAATLSASEREACAARRPSEVSGPEALGILMFLRNTLQKIVFHMFHA